MNKTLSSHLRDSWKRHGSLKVKTNVQCHWTAAFWPSQGQRKDFVKKKTQWSWRIRFQAQSNPPHEHSFFKIFTVIYIQFLDAEVCVWLSRSCGCAVTVANSESLCVSTGAPWVSQNQKGLIQWVKSKHWDLHVSLGQTERERLDLQGPPKNAIHSCPRTHTSVVTPKCKPTDLSTFSDSPCQYYFSLYMMSEKMLKQGN